MTQSQINLQTGGGTCPTHLFIPDEEGVWPAVIIYMDIFGMRKSQLELAGNLSSKGYVVLLPDIFYRLGHYIPPDPQMAFSGNWHVIEPMRASTDTRKAADDTAYFLRLLEQRPEVRPGRFGAVGYCFGGALALVAAASYPDKFGAVALFHAGNLVTDQETSPHLHVSRLKAELYIGAADNDSSYPPAMAETLLSALDNAGVSYEHEVYEGAAHGWTQPEFPVYDSQAAERHWNTLDSFLKRTIG